MPLDTRSANRRALSADGMNKLSKTETEKSAPAPGGKGAGRGAENPTITKLFFEVVRSEVVEPSKVINGLDAPTGRNGPLAQKGNFG